MKLSHSGAWDVLDTQLRSVGKPSVAALVSSLNMQFEVIGMCSIKRHHNLFGTWVNTIRCLQSAQKEQKATARLFKTIHVDESVASATENMKRLDIHLNMGRYKESSIRFFRFFPLVLDSMSFNFFFCASDVRTVHSVYRKVGLIKHRYKWYPFKLMVECPLACLGIGNYNSKIGKIRKIEKEII